MDATLLLVEPCAKDGAVADGAAFYCCRRQVAGGLALVAPGGSFLVASGGSLWWHQGASVATGLALGWARLARVR